MILPKGSSSFTKAILVILLFVHLKSKLVEISEVIYLLFFNLAYTLLEVTYHKAPSPMFDAYKYITKKLISIKNVISCICLVTYLLNI